MENGVYSISVSLGHRFNESVNWDITAGSSAGNEFVEASLHHAHDENLRSVLGCGYDFDAESTTCRAGVMYAF